jgi:hypothetical protein
MMRYRRAAVLLLTALWLRALPAYAGPPFGCCYCTSQKMGNRAVLCEAVPSIDINDFEAKCGANGGNSFSCVAALSPDVCPGVFRAADLVCPHAAGAPLMSPTAALALAAVLAALGAVALRNRGRTLRAAASSASSS